ncbi:MAG: thiamine phosphate synthase [Sphingobacteriales bacterium]|jgi:thiamine-phosphate pyrophosphorylase|nr:MAG: thiamine phosphate synthase [Sphingobacteriales bacterium]
MQTILYTPAENIENEIDTIVQLLDNGVDYLYIYKPELDDFSLVDFVETIPEKYWKQCISTSLIITKEFDLGGYHFTRDIVQKNELYNEKILKWLSDTNKISSVTAHSIDELNKYAPNFKHIIVSPLFPSISKENYSYDWNMEELRIMISDFRIKSQILNLKSQIFAVGGVDTSKISIVKNLNFDGIGLLGFIWNDSSNALKNFNIIKSKFIQ